MDFPDVSPSMRPTVYEVHAKRLQERYWSSFSSLEGLPALSDPSSSSSDLSSFEQQPIPQELLFRCPGSKAGSHPHQPWQHSALRDAYERVNVWSHAVPGVLFCIASLTVRQWAGEAAAPMALFCGGAAVTHTFSAIGHVYPDSHVLEKADHVGIASLIVTSAMSSLEAIEHGHVPRAMYVLGLLLLVGSFLRPLPRVAAMAAGTAGVVVLFGQEIYTFNLGCQLVLYSVAALTFLRNEGHHRCVGLSDHHLLHYSVTAACLLQVANIMTLVQRNP